MNHIFFIIVNILFSPFLLASYACTEQELINLRIQAEKAWPDIEDAEAFKTEFHGFLLKCPLPFCDVKDEDSFFCLLPKDSLDSIWIHQANSDKEFIIACDNKNSYCRLITKGIVIRDSWMKKKGLTSIAEPQTLQFYYGLLKGLFLENEEALFLHTVCTLIKNTKHPFAKTPTVCMLKDKSEYMPLKNQSQQISYHMHAVYSIMATFLLHKLLEQINSTNNNQTLHKKNVPQSHESNNQVKKTESQVKPIDEESIHLKNNVDEKKTAQNSPKNQSPQPTSNQNNDKKNRTGYVYYVIPTTIIVSILIIFLYRNYLLNNCFF